MSNIKDYLLMYDRFMEKLLTTCYDLIQREHLCCKYSYFQTLFVNT